MKKLITTPIIAGVAYPPSKKGFDFLYLSNQEIFASLAQALSGDPIAGTESFVLYGCEKHDLGGGNFSFDAGYIYNVPNNEVYLFPGHTSMAIATVAILKLDTTSSVKFPTVYNPSVFTDGSTHNVHQNNQLIVSDGALNSGLINFDDLLLVNTTTQRAPSYAGSFIADPGSPIKYRRKNRTLRIKGTTHYSVPAGIGGNITLFTLPVGFRPLETQSFPSTDVIGGTIGAVQITSAGVVSLRADKYAMTSENFINISIDLD